MTLLSNGFIATAESKPTQDGQYSPASTTTTTVDGPTPSQILSITIRKKRKILKRKNQDLRLELLLTSTIRRLCQEIGDQLRSKRIQKRRDHEEAATISRKRIRTATDVDHDGLSIKTERRQKFRQRKTVMVIG
jgi:hypothetical protein